jgi:hypothetical protein
MAPSRVVSVSGISILKPAGIQSLRSVLCRPASMKGFF